MANGVTLEKILEVGAFLPKTELEKASASKFEDGSIITTLPFADEALKGFKSLIGPNSTKENLPDLTEWWTTVQNTMKDPQRTAPHFQKELNEFIETGRSNGRPMQYARMRIDAGKSFTLHAHPNMEIDFVMEGTMYERRLKAEYWNETKNFGQEYSTDLSSLPPEAFETRKFTKGQVLLNETGSIHRSYTVAEEGVDLFVLWGGGLCNVPDKFTPESERVEKSPPVGNCSTWVANALVDAGVTVVYGGHGGALAPLVNAVVANERLKWVCCRNEANASLMAAAHAKYTGELACVIATSGPGATNLTTGLMEATLDRVPVLCLTGLKPRQGMHYSEFQDVDQSRLFAAGGVEFSYDVASPEALVPLLRDAVAIATTRNTCAHLAIPVDIQAAPCPIPVDKPFCAAFAGQRVAPPPGSVHLDPVLDDIVNLLSVDSKKILIAIGLRGVQAGKDIPKLAEHLRAPIVTRLDAKGAVDELHPLVLGVEGIHGKPGMETSATLMETADIVLNFGVTDPTLLVCNTAGLQVREMIEFETTALMVSTRFRAMRTCIGDMGEIARALVERFQTRGDRQLGDVKSLRSSLQATEPEVSTDFSVDSATQEERLMRAQIGAIDLARKGIPSERAERAAKIWSAIHSGSWKNKRFDYKSLESIVLNHEEQSEYPHPAHVLMEVSSFITEETTVCIDTGDVTLWGGLCLKLEGGRTLTSERLGTMGYSLCAGIASIFAREEPATALVLAGDGGFQMTLQELATFQQCKRPGDRLIVIVFDNQLLGRVIFGFDGAQGCELHGPNFAGLAENYGGKGYRLNDAESIGQHFRDADEGLTILHVPIDPQIKADMATFKDGAVKMMNSG